MTCVHEIPTPMQLRDILGGDGWQDKASNENLDTLLVYLSSSFNSDKIKIVPMVMDYYDVESVVDSRVELNEGEVCYVVAHQDDHFVLFAVCINEGGVPAIACYDCYGALGVGNFRVLKTYAKHLCAYLGKPGIPVSSFRVARRNWMDNLDNPFGVSHLMSEVQTEREYKLRGKRKKETTFDKKTIDIIHVKIKSGGANECGFVSAVTLLFLLSEMGCDIIKNVLRGKMSIGRDLVVDCEQLDDKTAEYKRRLCLAYAHVTIHSSKDDNSTSRGPCDLDVAGEIPSRSMSLSLWSKHHLEGLEPHGLSAALEYLHPNACMLCKDTFQFGPVTNIQGCCILSCGHAIHIGCALNNLNLNREKPDFECPTCNEKVSSARLICPDNLPYSDRVTRETHRLDLSVKNALSRSSLSLVDPQGASNFTKVIELFVESSEEGNEGNEYMHMCIYMIYLFATNFISMYFIRSQSTSVSLLGTQCSGIQCSNIW